MYQGGRQRSHNKNASFTSPRSSSAGRIVTDPGPPHVLPVNLTLVAPEASRSEAAVAKMICRGIYLSCPEAARAVDMRLEAKRGGLAERGEWKSMQHRRAPAKERPDSRSLASPNALAARRSWAPIVALPWHLRYRAAGVAGRLLALWASLERHCGHLPRVKI